MTKQMHDVVMLSEEEVTIDGETYSLEQGDVVSLSFKTARNYVNQFGIARWHGDNYPVRDDEYVDELGPTGEKVETESSGDKDNEEDRVLDGNVGEIEEEVSGIEDEEFLASLAEAEAEGEDRKGVHNAIQGRVEELGEIESEGEDNGEDENEEE